MDRWCRRLLEHDERIALADGLALGADDLRDGAGVFGLDGHLHLHRLEDRNRVALLDRVADRTLDFPDGARDVGLNNSHLKPPDADRRTPGTIAFGDDRSCLRAHSSSSLPTTSRAHPDHRGRNAAG